MTNTKKEQLKKTKIAFWMSLGICIISMIVVFKSVDTNIIWKIVASSVGFLGFLSLTLLAFKQLMRLQKNNITD